MPEKKIPTNFEVQIYGGLEYYTPTISKARVRIFYRGRNRNGSYITDEFAEKLIKTLPYAPVKGIYDEEAKDFTDHGNGIKSLGKAYGVVPENGNGQWERHIDKDGVERMYWCTDVLLWTSLYQNAKEIPGKSQSMELDFNSIKGEWKDFGDFIAYEFTEGCFLGLQVLGSIDGVEVEPCFEGSAFYTKQQAEELKNQFSEIIKIAKNYNLQKEEPKMETKDIQSTDAIAEEVVEAIEEAVQTTEAEVVETTETEVVETETAEVAAPETEHTVEEVKEETSEDTSEAEIPNYKEKFNALSEETKELKEKFSKLSDEFSVLTDKFNHLQTERDNLAKFKNTVETNEKKQVIDKYTGILNSDIIKSYADNLDKYSTVELEKELCFEVHKNDNLEPQTANFSYKNNETSEVVTPLMSCLSDYRIN